MVETLRLFFDSIGVDWVLWLLLSLSVISLGVVIERAVFYTVNSADVARIAEILKKTLEAHDTAATLNLLGRLKGLEATVLLEGMKNLHRGPAAVENIIESAVARERVRYDRYLPFLGTLGNNAPFIGLFGTVLGIIGAFQDLSGSVAGDKARNAALMLNISEALVATAVGLLVAIPAVVAFNHFKGKIKERIGNTEALSKLLLAYINTEPLAREQGATPLENEARVQASA